MHEEADDDRGEEDAERDFVEGYDEEHGADGRDNLIKWHVAVAGRDAAHAFHKAAEGVAKDNAESDEKSVQQGVDFVVWHKTQFAKERDVVEPELQIADGNRAKNAEDEAAEGFVVAEDAFAEYFAITIQRVAEDLEVSAYENRHHIGKCDGQEKIENAEKIPAHGVFAVFGLLKVFFSRAESFYPRFQSLPDAGKNIVHYLRV